MTTARHGAFGHDFDGTLHVGVVVYGNRHGAIGALAHLVCHPEQRGVSQSQSS